MDRYLAILASIAPYLPPTHPLIRLEAARKMGSGASVEDVCREHGLREHTVGRIANLIQAGDPRPIFGNFAGVAQNEVDEERFRLAQLLLGALAEERFEREKEELTAGRLSVEDHRLGRGDTDYRVLNGGQRPIFRINIKFHGSAFDKAQENVGLRSDDCFALATYKIGQALSRQREEDLPYVFLVLSCLGLTAKLVAATVPEDLARFAMATKKLKRDVQDAIIRLLVSVNSPVDPRPTRERIATAEFRVISATTAERLMKEKLFERVFALRRRAFTRAFRNAEIDMHFPLSTEMIPLRDFLTVVASESPQRLAILLDRGKLA